MVCVLTILFIQLVEFSQCLIDVSETLGHWMVERHLTAMLVVNGVSVDPFSFEVGSSHDSTVK